MYFLFSSAKSGDDMSARACPAQGLTSCQGAFFHSNSDHSSFSFLRSAPAPREGPGGVCPSRRHTRNGESHQSQNSRDNAAHVSAKYAPQKLTGYRQNFLGEQGTKRRGQRTPIRCRDYLASATLQNGLTVLTAAWDAVLHGPFAKCHAATDFAIKKNRLESGARERHTANGISGGCQVVGAFRWKNDASRFLYRTPAKCGLPYNESLL
jgi:hypothetical protein